MGDRCPGRRPRPAGAPPDQRLLVAEGDLVAASRAPERTARSRSARAQTPLGSQPVAELAGDDPVVVFAAATPAGGPQRLVGVARSDVQQVEAVLRDGTTRELPLNEWRAFSYLAPTPVETAIGLVGRSSDSEVGVVPVPQTTSALSPTAVQPCATCPQTTAVATAEPSYALFERRAGTALTRIDPRTLAAVGRPLLLSGYRYGPARSPDGTTLAIAASDRATVELIDLERLARVASIPLASGERTTVRTLAWLRDDRLLAVVQRMRPPYGRYVQSRQLVVIDPLTRRVVARTPITNKLAINGVASAGDHLVLLLKPQAPRKSSVDAARRRRRPGQGATAEVEVGTLRVGAAPSCARGRAERPARVRPRVAARPRRGPRRRGRPRHAATPHPHDPARGRHADPTGRSRLVAGRRSRRGPRRRDRHRPRARRRTAGGVFLLDTHTWVARLLDPRAHQLAYRDGQLFTFGPDNLGRRGGHRRDRLRPQRPRASTSAYGERSFARLLSPEPTATACRRARERATPSTTASGRAHGRCAPLNPFRIELVPEPRRPLDAPPRDRPRRDPRVRTTRDRPRPAAATEIPLVPAAGHATARGSRGRAVPRRPRSPQPPSRCPGPRRRRTERHLPDPPAGVRHGERLRYRHDVLHPREARRGKRGKADVRRRRRKRRARRDHRHARTRHPVALTPDGGFIWNCRAYNGCACVVAELRAFDQMGKLVTRQDWRSRSCAKRTPSGVPQQTVTPYRFSTQGRPVTLRPDAARLFNGYAVEARLLATEAGRAFYRLRRPPDVECYATGKASNLGEIGSMGCPGRPGGQPLVEFGRVLAEAGRAAARRPARRVRRRRGRHRRRRRRARKPTRRGETTREHLRVPPRPTECTKVIALDANGDRLPPRKVARVSFSAGAPRPPADTCLAVCDQGSRADRIGSRRRDQRGRNGVVVFSAAGAEPDIAAALHRWVSYGCFRLAPQPWDTESVLVLARRYQPRLALRIAGLPVPFDGCEIQASYGHRWPDRFDSHSAVEVAFTERARRYFDDRAAARDLALFVRSGEMRPDTSEDRQRALVAAPCPLWQRGRPHANRIRQLARREDRRVGTRPADDLLRAEPHRKPALHRAPQRPHRRQQPATAREGVLRSLGRAVHEPCSLAGRQLRPPHWTA